MKAATIANIIYIVPISLWLVEYSHLFTKPVGAP
jgi:hypothetical protein